MRTNVDVLRKTVFVGLAVVPWLLLSANAEALTLHVKADDSVVEIDDDSVADANPTPGIVGFDGALGSFSVIQATGFSKSVVGDPTLARMNLSVVSITGDTPGNLVVSLTDTDFGPGTGSGDALLTSSIGGTTNGSTTFQSYVDSANAAFGIAGPEVCETAVLGPFGGAFDDTTSVLCAAVSRPFSLTLVAKASLPANSVQSFGANAQIPIPPPEEEVGSCRMTGGNATVSPAVGADLQTTWTYDFESTQTQAFDTGFWITTGGQINAPSGANADGNFPGHWTHTQHGGAEGGFTFHAGTSSAPDGTFISSVECNDPGWCVQARCAPYKQLFWKGVGNFANQHFDADFTGTGCSVIPTKGGKGTLHYVEAMIGDFGENDRPTREDSLVDADPDTCNWFDKLDAAGYSLDPPEGPWNAADAVFLDSAEDDHFGYKGGQVCDKCPDYYQIRIFCNETPEEGEEPIYQFAGYLQHGNYQIHPETGEQCPATEELVPELFETTKVTGKNK